MENSGMDRFFSKLDLKDIKIRPEGSRFLPDADEAEPSEAQDDEVSTEEFPAQESSNIPTGPTAVEPSSPWEPIPTIENGQYEPEFEFEDDHARVLPIEVVHQNGEVLKVSAKSRPSAVAGAIAGVVREEGRAEVQAIGAGATNQAVKAVAIAREYLLETGIEAICLPAFIDVTIENEERTAIRLIVEPR
jgi:stage V sporulation protein S